ncbi:MAG: hypothetical protein ACKVP7_07290 [Hyphomicrobiaceae bacterium]
MTVTADTAAQTAAERRRGWFDAAGFVVALTALNIAYGLAHAAGAHPVAFLVYAMLIAAMSLLLITGPGPHWLAVIRHPLSWVVGFGIIGMEAGYYLLLLYVTPAEGSVLNRINLPVSILAGWLLFGRRTSLISFSGIVLMSMAVGLYVTTIPHDVVWMALFLGTLCALISVTRNFSAEFHPWNRSAKTVFEKMRITGLMLLVTSVTGTAVVGGLMALVHGGLVPPSAAIPAPGAFAHLPTLGLAAFMGVFVLTAMQYFGFSAVVRIGTERFIAAGSMVPVTTLLVQNVAAMLGVLPVALVDGRFIAIMLGVVVGVFVFIAGGRKQL